MSDFDWSDWMSDGDGEGPPLFAFNEVGDAVVGVLTELVVVKTKFGDKPRLTLDTDNGPVAVIAGGVGLQNALAEKNPQVGCKVGIKFSDTKDTGKGNPLKLYEVKVAHPKDTAPEPPQVDGADLGEFSEEPF